MRGSAGFGRVNSTGFPVSPSRQETEGEQHSLLLDVLSCRLDALEVRDAEREIELRAYKAEVEELRRKVEMLSQTPSKPTGAAP
jgi:hypothetical protein